MSEFRRWIAVLLFRCFAFGKYVFFSLRSRWRGNVCADGLSLHDFQYRPVFQGEEAQCFHHKCREQAHVGFKRPWGARSFGLLPWTEKIDANTPAIQGALLYWLVQRLGAHSVLELGTHCGVGTSYLAKAPSVNCVWTMDADERAIECAQTLWKCLNLSHKIRVIHGRFETHLEGVLQQMPAPQLVYMDGHHEGDATRRYFEILARYLPDGGCIVVDDIRWSGDMYRCWEALCAHPRTRIALDAGYMGIIRLQKAGDAMHISFFGFCACIRSLCVPARSGV